MNSTYEYTLKNGPKVKMENFWKTKSWRNFLEGLKQKLNVIIGIKTNILFNIQSFYIVYLQSFSLKKKLFLQPFKFYINYLYL